jgi:hypothetical protein
MLLTKYFEINWDFDPEVPVGLQYICTLVKSP